jgi:hypothetical protein
MDLAHIVAPAESTEALESKHGGENSDADGLLDDGSGGLLPPSSPRIVGGAIVPASPQQRGRTLSRTVARFVASSFVCGGGS